ncbi:MAG: hypothetical protein RIQ68_1562 [Pseudomonadota bacterium]|jgi:hypothetical protein
MSKISLEPAPAPKEAATASRYDFVAPLDTQGHIDVGAWKLSRALCFVHRKDKDGTVQHGLLVHRSGGAGGSTWVFDYELGQGDEESGFRFESHAFVAGEYVAIHDADGHSHTYRVAQVKPA